MDSAYSTKQISDQLKADVIESIKNIKGWGSVEICIQDYHVTQITEKNIKKTNNGKR
jgi:hypothetical protein